MPAITVTRSYCRRRGALAPVPVKMNCVGQQPLALLCLLSLLLSLTAAPLRFSPPRRVGEGWWADHFVGFDDAMGTRLAVGLLYLTMGNLTMNPKVN